jgi:non-ribosomal peptide synthetase component F
MPDQVVGLCMERGSNMIIGLLGILKAGAAYLPLDPGYPSERLRQMVLDAEPQLTITESKLVSLLPNGTCKQLLMDGLLSEIDSVADGNPPVGPASTGERLAYVIYTSGSTGVPKGTAMRHRSMVNLIEWQRTCLGPESGWRVPQYAALSFDVAFQEIFTTLCIGGSLLFGAGR